MKKNDDSKPLRKIIVTAIFVAIAFYVLVVFFVVPLIEKECNIHKIWISFHIFFYSEIISISFTACLFATLQRYTTISTSLTTRFLPLMAQHGAQWEYEMHSSSLFVWPMLEDGYSVTRKLSFKHNYRFLCCFCCTTRAH